MQHVVRLGWRGSEKPDGETPAIVRFAERWLRHGGASGDCPGARMAALILNRMNG
jgi:hypothetical protein